MQFTALVSDAEVIPENIKILPNDGSASDEFGQSVDTDAGVLAVGAKGGGVQGLKSGLPICLTLPQVFNYSNFRQMMVSTILILAMIFVSVVAKRLSDLCMMTLHIPNLLLPKFSMLQRASNLTSWSNQQ